MDELLERQADMIRYLQQHNANLGRRILELQSQALEWGRRRDHAYQPRPLSLKIFTSFSVYTIISTSERIIHAMFLLFYCEHSHVL